MHVYLEHAPPIPPVLRNNTRFVFIPHADLVFFLLSSGEYDELAGEQGGEGRECRWEEGERRGMQEGGLNTLYTASVQDPALMLPSSECATLILMPPCTAPPVPPLSDPLHRPALSPPPPCSL